MKYSISYVLDKKFNGRQWSLSNEDYSTLVILDGGAPISLSDIQQADLELQQLVYLDSRKAAYPPIINLMLMLWADMDSAKIASAPTFYAAIKSVNDQYPPPQGG